MSRLAPRVVDSAICPGCRLPAHRTHHLRAHRTLRFPATRRPASTGVGGTARAADMEGAAEAATGQAAKAAAAEGW